jgi:hypothetical protein
MPGSVCRRFSGIGLPHKRQWNNDGVEPGLKRLFNHLLQSLFIKFLIAVDLIRHGCPPVSGFLFAQCDTLPDRGE